MTTGLDSLSSTDRGFLTWVAGMMREPLEQVWTTLQTAGTRVDGRRIVALDLSPVGKALRERVGTRSLALPLAGLAVVELDVSGLDLDVLDVRLLPQLEALRCADNRIPSLDLSANAALRALDVTGNQIMVLELGAQAALEECRCAGNGLAVLVLPEGSPRLRVLDASRNQLMVLELGALPVCEELNVYRNALVRFSLQSAPALRRLDLGRNELDAVTLPVLPALTWLSVSRNKLDRFDPSVVPAVVDLKCHGNYLESLDLRPCPRLERLEAKANQLRSIALSPGTALAEADLADNRLERFEVDAPSLEVLRIGGNELTAFDCRGLPRLCQLDVSENALSVLQLAGAPELVELKCTANRLARLDVRANGHLVRLQSRDPHGEGPEILATELQQHRLRELRARHGLGTGATDPAGMDAFELHDLAMATQGADAEHRLKDIVTAPRCDLGTALLVYWTSSPHYYLKYDRREEVADFEVPGWDLLETIERRVQGDAYATRLIFFDPRHDRQTRSPRGVDWTADERIVRAPSKRSIPDFMKQATG